MSVTFFTPGAELGKYRLTENPDGSITIHLNDGEGVAAGWCTITSRLDAAHLRQMGADADALFIRRAAGAHDVIVPPAEDPLAGYQAASNELHYAEQDKEAADGLEPLPPLPQRPDRRDQEQADAASLLAKWGAKPKDVAALDALDAPEALAGQVPLESLAPEPEEDAEDEVKR